MATELIRFTQWAREKPQRQYNALMGMLMDPQGLNASFERQAGSKAPGIDGMRKADYAVGLPDRLADLSAPATPRISTQAGAARLYTEGERRPPRVRSAQL
jgi:hypothetical protein